MILFKEKKLFLNERKLKVSEKGVLNGEGMFLEGNEVFSQTHVLAVSKKNKENESISINKKKTKLTI